MEKPKCKLVGTDGNVFALMGKVRRALKQADQHEKADEFFRRATSASSYDEVLQILHDYVEAY
jgi:outer membrane protein TolC